MNLAARTFGQPYDALSMDETALAKSWEPSAYSSYYSDDHRPKPYRVMGDGVAVVDVLGALDTRGGWWWDGYDQIVARFVTACADPAVRAVVTGTDSPGGMAAGNLDAALAMRAAADACGKPWVAHAGTQATSAAYALACVADRLVLTSDGVVGSIGTIATIYDRTAANEAAGLNVRVIRSGDLKADPHPDVALTDASVARVRSRIVELGAMFASLVQQHRPQMGDPLAYRGAVVYGADAVAKGLADQVGTLADAVSLAAQLAADTSNQRKKIMDATKALAEVGAMRAMLKVGTDEEVAATVATLAKAAEKVPDLERQLAEARATLATREQAEKASARATVLQKHRDRGALSEADERDEAYMGSLANLTPAQLDANLSRLSGVPTPATKATAAGSTGTGTVAAGTVGTRGKISADEQKLALATGLTDDEYIAARDGKETVR